MSTTVAALNADLPYAHGLLRMGQYLENFEKNGSTLQCLNFSDSMERDHDGYAKPALRF